IHKLEKISSELGAEVYLKRDDQTGFEWSGNKIRKLEFLVEDARKKGATCLVTCGGVQSNHCRATAALAAKLGLRCVLLLRGEAPKENISNNLLDRLFGAEILYLTNEQYYEGMVEVRAMLDSQIRATGGSSYFIPEGGSNGLGCFGYAEAFMEIERQRKAGEIPGLKDAFDTIVVAHGSGGTQAGLVLGKLMAGADAPDTRIVGVNVCYGAKESFGLVKDALWQAIQQNNFPLSFFAEDIEMLDGYVGRGYALSTKAELEFLKKIAGEEGVLLDPVYTGKAFYGMYQTIKAEPARLGKKILFIHTGGAFGLFKLQEEWNEVLA
ncbi:MAG: 1-aminocyclopropane-1-carboxylate deaminase/D-cysteine desulfhydrase, partial [Bdellovibrionota bacterium]